MLNLIIIVTVICHSKKTGIYCLALFLWHRIEQNAVSFDRNARTSSILLYYGSCADGWLLVAFFDGCELSLSLEMKTDWKVCKLYKQCSYELYT